MEENKLTTKASKGGKLGPYSLQGEKGFSILSLCYQSLLLFFSIMQRGRSMNELLSTGWPKEHEKSS